MSPMKIKSVNYIDFPLPAFPQLNHFPASHPSNLKHKQNVSIFPAKNWKPFRVILVHENTLK